jgi:hypothetical protein
MYESDKDGPPLAGKPARLPFEPSLKPAPRTPILAIDVGSSSPGNETPMVMNVDSRASSKHPVLLTARLDPAATGGSTG